MAEDRNGRGRSRPFVVLRPSFFAINGIVTPVAAKRRGLMCIASQIGHNPANSVVDRVSAGF